MNKKLEDSAELPVLPQKLTISKVSAKGIFSIEASQDMYFQDLLQEMLMETPRDKLDVLGLEIVY